MNAQARFGRWLLLGMLLMMAACASRPPEQGSNTSASTAPAEVAPLPKAAPPKQEQPAEAALPPPKAAPPKQEQPAEAELRPPPKPEHPAEAELPPPPKPEHPSEARLPPPPKQERQQPPRVAPSPDDELQRAKIASQDQEPIQPVQEPQAQLSPASAALATISDPFQTVDQALAKMQLGNIAFNTPASLHLGETTSIQLKLGLRQTVDELKRAITVEGPQESARIRVSDVMEARLTGAGFTITANTSERQPVSGVDVTEWSWDIKPTSAGRQVLHLTLSALISVDGISTPRTIRTFDKNIDIEVTWPQIVSSFVGNNWQWLWATILVPLAAWLWKKRSGAEPPENKSIGKGAGV